MIVALTLLASSAAVAEEGRAGKAEADEPAVDVSEEEQSVSGIRLQSAAAFRLVPEGARLTLAGGYRLGLFDSDSLLLNGTYAEGGVTTDLSPSNVWIGPYLEFLPVQVLKLFVTAQSLSYFGTFGYLHIPDDQADPDWSVDAISDDISDGQPAHGWLVDARATPQLKLGNVVFLGETKLVWVDMGVDEPYYESSFDFLLEPEDLFWVTQPTLGWVFVMDGQWILTGARWEHAETDGTDLSRDMAALLGLWKLPWELWGGEMKWALLGGYWVDHPNRSETFYLATQFSVDWAP